MVMTLALFFCLQDPQIDQVIDLGDMVVVEGQITTTIQVMTDKGPGQGKSDGPVVAATIPVGATSLWLAEHGRRSLAFARNVWKRAAETDQPSTVLTDVREGEMFVTNNGDSVIVAVIETAEDPKDPKKSRLANVMVFANGVTRLVQIPEGGSVRIVNLKDGTYFRPARAAAKPAKETPSAFAFNTGPFTAPSFQPIFGAKTGKSLSMNVSDFDSTMTDSFGNVLPTKLEYDEKSFTAFEFGATANCGLLEFSLGVFTGSWEGRGVFTMTDRFGVTTTTETAIDGDLLGVELQVFWPAFKIQAGILGFEAGPNVGLSWMRETLDAVDASPADLSDTLTEIVGELGFKANASIKLGIVVIGIGGQVSRMEGKLAGTAAGISGGFGFSF